jgi:diguanylate cyclase (GGDEF)-like protein/PAS domain S-box-containing protein
MKFSIRTRSLALAAFVAASVILVVAGSIVLDHRLHVRDEERVARVVDDVLAREQRGADIGVVIARQLSEEREQLLARRLAALALVGVATLVLALVVAWQVARRIERPLESLRDAALRLASGERGPLEVAREGHTSEVAFALERLTEHIKEREATARWLDAVLDNMGDAVFVTTADGRILRANAAAARLTGFGAEELTGRALASLIADQDRAGFDIERASMEVRELTVGTRSGQIIPVSLGGSRMEAGRGDPATRIFVAHDITSRKRAERRIRYLARYDALTKVPNRLQFQHSLQQAIARARRNGRSLALLYLDLDQFKEINDTFGHAAGDRALEILSERLIAHLPKETMLGRLAGDEFGLFVENLTRDEDARPLVAGMARELLERLARPFHVGNQEVFITASLGIALCPRDADNVVDLIRDADAAMYHSKQNGGNNYSFYSPEMSAVAVERLMLKSKLRRAIERDELVMLYQPKVDLERGRVVGAEALLRWRLPGHGDIPPAQFIPLAEESNLILDIGEWVLKRVCQDYRRWQDQVPQPGRVSINLSLKQLRQAEFIPRCRTVFDDLGVAPSNFELEITETTLMTDARRMLGLLDELRSMGVHLAIDDFGTGYSSLAALQQFPVGTLKIDRSFVRDAAVSREDATLVKTIIEMGRNLDLEVVAEGIETAEQLAYLRGLDCHLGQGTLFGEPMAADSLLDLLLGQARGERRYRELFG